MARAYGVRFHKPNAKQRYATWRWETPAGEPRSVRIDGRVVLWQGRRRVCRTAELAEELAGQIAEECAGAEPGARVRRAYLFEQ